MNREYLSKAIFASLALVVGLGVGYGWSYWSSFKDVTISLPSDTTASIYKNMSTHESYEYDQNKPVKTIAAPEKVRLQTGRYVVVVDDPKEQYQNPLQQITVSTDDTIEINPSLKESQLVGRLNSERTTISAALSSQLPKMAGNYTVASDKIYLSGRWYGAVLKPNDPIADTLRLIMKKEGSEWKLITKSPHVTVGQPSYPEVPFEVLSAVNQLN